MLLSENNRHQGGNSNFITPRCPPYLSPQSLLSVLSEKKIKGSIRKAHSFNLSRSPSGVSVCADRYFLRLMSFIPSETESVQQLPNNVEKIILFFFPSPSTSFTIYNYMHDRSWKCMTQKSKWKISWVQVTIRIMNMQKLLLRRLKELCA